MALEQLEREMPYSSIAELVEKNRDSLDEYGRVPVNRLKALEKGDRPTELEIARLALALGLDESYIEALATK